MSHNAYKGMEAAQQGNKQHQDTQVQERTLFHAVELVYIRQNGRGSNSNLLPRALGPFSDIAKTSYTVEIE